MRRLLAIAAGLLALALGAGLLTAGNPAAQAQESRSISGVVRNGTAGAALPGDLAALLLITDAEGRLQGTGQAAIGADGRFTFAEVPLIPEASYTISVDYGGVFYGPTLPASALAQPVNITIYESTTDYTLIRVQRQVMLLSAVDAAQRTAAATEFVRLENTGDRTLQPDLAAPGQISFLRFALPPDAAEVTLQSNLRGGDVISIGSGFALTAPVPPGEHIVDFSYTFPYADDGLAYRQSLPQGAGLFQVLLPESWETAELAALQPLPVIALEGARYRAWEARDIPPGPGLQLEFSGLPQPGMLARLGATLSGGGFWQTAVPSALAAVLVALLLTGVIRKYRPQTAAAVNPTPSPTAPPIATANRHQIVAEIAQLDEQFAAGAIPAPEYHRQREELLDEALNPTPDDPDESEREAPPPTTQ